MAMKTDWKWRQQMATRPRGYGLTAEVNRKIQDKYDVVLEQQARVWMEQILDDEMVTGADPNEPLGLERFHAALKDGVWLCRLINALHPNSVKSINKKQINFFMMENIGNFLDACGKYGLNKNDQFHTAALFERTNMTQVVNTIHALGRAAQKNGYMGPVLGVKESDSNPRNFSEDKLREGQTIIGLQMGTNRGANQHGINFGKSRSITD